MNDTTVINHKLGYRVKDFTPCESPIEDIFFYDIQKYLALDVELKKQHRVNTAHGNFRMDFMAEQNGRKIGFECDGKEFHDTIRDYERDMAITESGSIAKIYRFKGCDIYHRVEDCLDILRLQERRLFSERGNDNIFSLTTPRHCNRDWIVGDGQSAKHFSIMRKYVVPKGVEDDSIGNPRLQMIINVTCTKSVSERYVDPSGEWYGVNPDNSPFYEDNCSDDGELKIYSIAELCRMCEPSAVNQNNS